MRSNDVQGEGFSIVELLNGNGVEVSPSFHQSSLFTKNTPIIRPLVFSYTSNLYFFFNFTHYARE